MMRASNSRYLATDRQKQEEEAASKCSCEDAKKKKGVVKDRLPLNMDDVWLELLPFVQGIKMF